MDPVTLALLAGLGSSTIGAAGQAYLGTQSANATERQAKKDREEQIRQFNLGEARASRNEPFQQASALDQLRQSVFKPSTYDFLGALSSRYSNAA